ncbi:unnamed protein product [Brassica napus]|uniref:(rape) hypothetical protein n=1 Tax=Brassica napus TaxID=3708 RepID=A0A816VYI5_BRANA|nr:unnamed protein product [Brassica napus]
MRSWGRFFREIGSVLTGRKEEEEMKSCGDPSYRREKERSWRVTTENSDKMTVSKKNGHCGLLEITGLPHALASQSTSVDETSPQRGLDTLGSFNFRGINPLEQLGLYMKQDEDEEEPEAPPNVPRLAADMEEGEID